MACRVGARTLHLEELHRFPQRRRAGARLALLGRARHPPRGARPGIREVARTGPLHGIGIDSWAVDYGLLDRDGQLLANPRSHRDSPHRRRTRPGASRASRTPSCTTSPGCSSCRSTPSTSWSSALGTPALEAAETLLLLPGPARPTGSPARSAPSAPTPRPPGCTTYARREWALDLAKRLGLPWSILPPLRDPGAWSARCWPRWRSTSACPDVPVIAVGSHDTASAVVGVPGRRGELRLHLLGHLVAGRPGARGAGALGGGPARPTSPTRAASTAPSASSRT